MKWFIASDIHGSAYYCRKMLERYKAENADRMLLLGDILYHGPRNDLPEGYAPKEVIEMLNALRNMRVSMQKNVTFFHRRKIVFIVYMSVRRVNNAVS